jgi:uncharacterized protein YfiM (DUF2279 family)
MKGFLWSSGLWTFKEFLDSRMANGVCSRKDIATDILGAAIGAGGAYYFIQLQPSGGMKETYFKTF